jgi:hypothetical protein
VIDEDSMLPARAGYTRSIVRTPADRFAELATPIVRRNGAFETKQVGLDIPRNPRGIVAAEKTTINHREWLSAAGPRKDGQNKPFLTSTIS